MSQFQLCLVLQSVENIAVWYIDFDVLGNVLEVTRVEHILLEKRCPVHIYHLCRLMNCHFLTHLFFTP